MKCPKCESENDSKEGFCSKCQAPLRPFEKMLWDEIQGMYKNNKDRIGHASMFTAILTGIVLIITGLADAVEFRPILSRDLVLIGGGILIPIAFWIRWYRVEQNEKKKSEGS